MRPALVTSICLLLMNSSHAQTRPADTPFNYVHEGSTRSYVATLLTPAGLNILRDSPADHKHHHGLMLALEINGVNFWAEGRDCGVQAGRDFVARLRDNEISEQLDLVGPDKSIIARERRTISARKSAGATILTWRSVISPPKQESNLAITKGHHYYGVGMRFVESMDKISRFIFPEDAPAGEVVRGDERLTPARWCACVGVVEGKPVTVAMFDAPSNPRPAVWFTMSKGFAYLAATLGTWKEPLALKPGADLRLTYGIAARDGEIDKREIEKGYADWIKGADAK